MEILLEPTSNKLSVDSEFDQEENEEEIGDNEEEEEDKFVRTPFNDSDDETKISDKAQGDEDEEIDYTTSQLYDDVDIRLNKPVQADDETVQKEGTDAELTNIQRGNENKRSPKSLKMLIVCYDGLVKSYELYKTLFSTYDKVYSLKRSQKDKDKDEDPFVGSDRRLKKRKTSKDAKPSKDEPEFEVADSDMPQDQKENPGNDDEKPKGKVTSKRDWFNKPKRPQEPTDLDWNDEKTSR
nr:hypothetical protein [Tanacetum cinerariifolium]